MASPNRICLDQVAGVKRLHLRLPYLGTRFSLSQATTAHGRGSRIL